MITMITGILVNKVTSLLELVLNHFLLNLVIFVEHYSGTQVLFPSSSKSAASPTGVVVVLPSVD